MSRKIAQFFQICSHLHYRNTQICQKRVQYFNIKAGRERGKFCQVINKMHHTSHPQLSVLTVQVSVGMKNNSVWRYAHWKPHKGFTFVVTSYSYQSKYSKYYTVLETGNQCKYYLGRWCLFCTMLII